MDAVQTLLKKAALFSALALLVFAGGLQAQPAFNPVNGGVPLQLGTGGGFVPITGSQDPATPITFSASFTSFSTPGGGSFAWVAFSSATTGTTPSELDFRIVSTGATQGTFTATVTLTPTGASATAHVLSTTFQVQYVSGSTGGGGGSGVITASTTNLQLTTNPGNVTSGSVTLSTTSPTAIPFTIAVLPANSWLSAGSTSTSVSNGLSATLTAVGNAIGITTNQTGSITITPTSGGTPTVISVTLNVGNGTTSGNITASPNPVSFSYTSNSGVFPAQFVTLQTTTGGLNYTASANSFNNWLLVNGGITGVSGTLAGGMTLSASGNITTLTTGSYQGTVTVSDSNGGSGTITVNLSVNGGTTSGLTFNPSTGLTFTGAVGSGTTAAQSLSITSGISGTLTVTCSPTTWLVCSGIPASISANSATFISVIANASGLTNSTYNGQISVTVTGNSTLSGSVPVSFVVGTGSGGGGGGSTSTTVTPSSLVFAYQTGTPINFVSRQTLALTGPAGGGWSATTTTTNNGGWLAVSTISSSFQGDGTGTTTVIINPSGLTAGTYTGTVNINSNGTTQTAGVTLTVGTSPVLLSQPGSLVFNFHTGDSALAPAGISFFMSDNSAVSITATTTTPWLTVSQTAGSSAVGVTANAGSMASGTYSGAITVTQGNASNSPLTIPVVLLVNGGSGGGGGTGGPLSLNPTALNFSAQVGTNPSPQNLAVSATTGTSFSVNTSVSNASTNWLLVNSASTTSGSTNTTLLVSVISSSLGVGTYNGTITFTANSTTQTVPVQLNITTTGGGGNTNVTVDKSSLTFTAQSGSASQSQVLNVSSAQGSAGVSFNVSSSVISGGSWLSISPPSGTTPAQVSVSVNPASLAAGTYNGTVSISPSGGNAVSVSVSITVTAPPTVTASPGSLTFTYRAGDAAPASQQISVTGGTSLTFSATASSTGNWLSVSPTTGTTPATLAVSINPTGLNASPTPYNGTITVAGTGGALGTTTISVSLTVTAPLPTVSKLTNAGSFGGAAISPGEIITLFASDSQHPIGPTPAVSLTLDTTGKSVVTTIGGTSVLIGGFAAPMIFANATQVSAVVPYELAGFLTADVLVRFLGQTSNAISVNVAATAPGLFTLNSSGTGPGAILNSNNSVNSPTNPAAKGETVVVYLTGEGQTSPRGVTGKVTTVSATPPLTPVPLLQVSVLIGQPGAQQAANFSFAGEAPGLVSGVMQLNVQIPTTAPTGNLPIVVSIGGTPSQTGVTVSVK